MNLDIIILAAGQGARMRSVLPKVLHPLGGRPLLAHVLETARRFDKAKLHVVVGHGGDRVRDAFPDPAIHWVTQEQQLGTGHAVAQVLPRVPNDHAVLVMYGDVPLIRKETLGALQEIAMENQVGLLTAELDDPAGYGRILRAADGSIVGSVEEKDATDEQCKIREVNTGFVAAPAGDLRNWVNSLDNNNTQGEYYLTDIIARAVTDGTKVCGVTTRDRNEVLGVNTRAQLATLERGYQLRQAMACMEDGVTLIDPDRFDLRGRMVAGQDVVIDVNAVLEGEITLGDRVHIGPNCVLRNITAGDDVTILANCVLEEATIGNASRIGPFSRIRPETHLAENTRVGNFVEIKNSVIANGSKVNHLSYIGDTTVGRDVNIGAGTITCNYDGANKHRTVIGDDVFIGSDTQLIAPVTVADGATIGAGSIITTDAPAGELTLSRVPQETRKGWKRPVKKK
ncbi:MAG: bifunctional UDP-N-acetylglucosamine diphosphorylase/glucosamine-1-phosphate N-acetyltransferase GlmU [Gammaproteobacteria bacterium]|nr:MAG: bifunctional UDP-N-acetylglucosamine diphosphorylase/glucosamine-1-phosphate N-acetyltransferase GlmU [Gammaproteobacteria bacterium]